ncbi:MAG TPA: MFS transporter [Acidimicrobiales bacterium]|nr:MFS transporter [Acidimicrobiales bacterium]
MRLTVAGAPAHATEGVVAEREVSPGIFEAAEGPVTRYRRAGERVDFKLAVPFFGWLFVLPVRHELRKQLRGTTTGMPWWAPADRLSARAATVLGALCAISLFDGYLGTLITQTLTYVADGLGVESDRSQGVTLAVVRLAIFLALPLVAIADRRGRRRMLLIAVTAGVVMAGVTALSPSIVWFTGAQTIARGFSTSLGILIVVIAAEEMPAGARAFAVSVTSMSAALGAGFCVMALPIADIGDDGWRLLYALPLVGLPLVALAARHLPESRRFVTPHADAHLAGHGGRFWLLAVAAFFVALFATPVSQLQNEFLRDERDYSAAAISLFTILTATPAGIAVLAGGHLAEARGRRLVGAVGLAGSSVLLAAMYLTSGPAMWTLSLVGSLFAGLTVPALRVYGPELFPTSLRAGSGGLITFAGVAGAASGVLAAGALSDALGGLGQAMSILAIGPLLVAVLVLTRFPETAHRELEELNPEDAAPPATPAPSSPGARPHP